ncbi:MAG: amidohydrolase [Acidobacteriia bacterium]|nr:amidohydrolase [Terriglobia bacterium]
MLIIDAHAHIYAEDDAQYPPIDKPIRPPGRSGSVGTLESLAKKNHVAGICIVQPGTFYRWDNRFICDVSKAHRKNMAGVCGLDPDDANSPQLLSGYVREYGVRGIRSYPASDGHLDHPGVQALWKKAGQLGIVVNVFINRDKTDELARMLEKFPRLPVVIDHCLIPKPMPDLEGAVADMIRLAKFAKTYAKLSFMPLGSAEAYPYRDVHEPCRRVIAAYGPGRCVWGSDFPCDLWTPKSSYAQHLRLFTHEMGLTDAAKKSILGRTAQSLWFRDNR